MKRNRDSALKAIDPLRPVHDVVIESDEIILSFRGKIISIVTPTHFQSCGVVFSESINDLLRGTTTLRIGLHRVVDRDDLGPQPATYGGISFLKRPQTGANHFARGGIATGGH
jgi:hypothetical protein